jgi:hypothetical protein
MTSKDRKALLHSLVRMRKTYDIDQDSEINSRLNDLIMAVSQDIYGMSVEWCAKCDFESAVDRVVNKCKNCRKMLIACNMCNAVGCSTCKNGDNFEYDDETQKD